jgi:hypothetical protein
MIIAGIYKKKLSEVNTLKFYMQVGAQEIAGDIPEKVQFVDTEGFERTCYYDHVFSKEVGHHAFVYEITVKGKPSLPTPTPINSDVANNAPEIDSGNNGAQA